MTIHFIGLHLKPIRQYFRLHWVALLNKCSFCNMYRTKDYLERPWEDIKKEIDLRQPNTTQKLVEYFLLMGVL